MKKVTRMMVDFGPAGRNFMVVQVAMNTFTVQAPLSDFARFQTTTLHELHAIKSVRFPMAIILLAMCLVSGSEFGLF